MATTDMNPGKYTSEKGEFYFACDEGDAVLVGVKGKNEKFEWTCPFLGLKRYDYDANNEQELANLIKLEQGSEMLYGHEDGEKIIKVPGQDLSEGEFGNSDEIKHVIVVMGDGFFVRLHLAFE